jgi:hypothetical protein
LVMQRRGIDDNLGPAGLGSGSRDLFQVMVVGVGRRE